MAYLWKHPKSNYWYAAFYDAEGKRFNRSTKVEKTERNRKQAQKIADAYEETVSKRKTVRHLRKVMLDLHHQITGDTLDQATVRHQFNRWLETKRVTTKASTVAFYEGATKKFVEYLGDRADRPLDEITRMDVMGFRDSQLKRVTARTANHCLKCIRMVFKDAKLNDLLDADPTELVGTVKVGETAGRRPFTPDEMTRLVNAASEEWRSMIYFGLYTGQRLGDIARLKWSNIDREAGEIQLVTGKTGRRQVVSIAAPLRRHLESLSIRPHAQEDPIHPDAFELAERQGNSSRLSKQFGKLLVETALRTDATVSTAPIPGSRRRTRNDISFHSLRRTAASLLHEYGVPSSVAQAFVGHESEEMHRGYVNIGKKALESAANQLSRHDIVQ